MGFFFTLNNFYSSITVVTQCPFFSQHFVCDSYYRRYYFFTRSCLSGALAHLVLLLQRRRGLHCHGLASGCLRDAGGYWNVSLSTSWCTHRPERLGATSGAGGRFCGLCAVSLRPEERGSDRGVPPRRSPPNWELEEPLGVNHSGRQLPVRGSVC